MASELFLLLERSVKLARESAHKIEINKTLREICIVGCYLQEIKLAEATLSLAAAKNMPGCASAVRAHLEASVEFENLITDPQYVHDFHWQYVKFWIKHLTSAKNGNKYLSSFLKELDLGEKLKELYDEKKRVEKSGGKYLSVKDKFTRIGYADQYESIYSFLSDYTHTGLMAILSEYTESDQASNFCSMIIDKEYGGDDFFTKVDLVLTNMIFDSVKLHAFYSSDFGGEFAAIGDELKSLHDKIGPRLLRKFD